MAQNLLSTRVYLARTDELNDAELFEKLCAVVSSERRTKIDRLTFRKDKRLSLAAGLLLVKGLREQGIERYEIEVGEHGKPRLKGGSVFFSLSHSGNTAMCAVSSAEVGCDVQQITEAKPKVAKRCFCPSEYETLLEADEETRRGLFFRYWTLKESFVKAIGAGLSVPFDSFELRIDGGSVSLSQDFDRRQFFFRELDLHDGYCYAVCALSPHFSQPEFVNLKEIF